MSNSALGFYQRYRGIPEFGSSTCTSWIQNFKTFNGAVGLQGRSWTRLNDINTLQWKKNSTFIGTAVGGAETLGRTLQVQVILSVARVLGSLPSL